MLIRSACQHRKVDLLKLLGSHKVENIPMWLVKLILMDFQVQQNKLLICLVNNITTVHNVDLCLLFH